MNNITVIVYDIKEVYDFTSQCFYDIYIQDECEDCDTVIFDALTDPNIFIELCKDGFTPVMLPRFDDIDALVGADKEFVVIVTKSDKIWAIVNGRDINY